MPPILWPLGGGLPRRGISVIRTSHISKIEDIFKKIPIRKVGWFENICLQMNLVNPESLLDYCTRLLMGGDVSRPCFVAGKLCSCAWEDGTPLLHVTLSFASQLVLHRWGCRTMFYWLHEGGWRAHPRQQLVYQKTSGGGLMELQFLSSSSTFDSPSAARAWSEGALDIGTHGFRPTSRLFWAFLPVLLVVAVLSKLFKLPKWKTFRSSFLTTHWIY